MPDYSKSIIYKLCCNDLTIIDLYIGSTTSFRTRKNKHKNACINSIDKDHNYPVYKFLRNNGNWNNWSMIQIEVYPCQNKRELESRERYWIEILKATLNTYIPLQTNKEWNIKFKDEIKIRRQIYRENNKEEIQAKKSEEIKCACGKSTDSSHKTRHEQSKFHQSYLASL